MRKMALLINSVILLVPLLALSHIPSTKFIFERTADNNGNGAYKITQDVNLISSGGTIRLREEWEVKDGDDLRLIVSGVDERSQGTRLERIYVGGARYLMQQGKIENQTLKYPMTESFFHTREQNHLMRLAISIGVIPAEAAKPAAKTKLTDEPQLKSNPYARIARTAGSISYAFGPPARKSSNPPAGLWIEQDQFLIQKIRFPDGAQVMAKDYSGYSRNLHFPKQRSFVWEDSRAEARLVNVTPANGASINLRASSLTTEDRLPEGTDASNLIRSFYSRFR